MDILTKNLIKEYENLEFVFGKKMILLLFENFNSYISIRETLTFHEIVDDLKKITDK